ncbi:MAG: molybdopterin synthase catalytic subunit MoaE, partial [Pseudomonadales bacterium]
MRKIKVQEAPFDVGAEHSALLKASRKTGAVCLFVGAVRDLNEKATVASLYLEHYPGMTEKEIEQIIKEAESRWSIIGTVAIHRIGKLSPGDEIVLVGVASEHRADAFAACEYIMDFLKTRATFWKKETTPTGERWLTTRQSDLDAAA